MHDESTADDANRRAAAQAHAADVHRRLERFFDLQAPIYDATRPFVLHGRDAAVELLDVRLGDSVLELACGTGLNFPRLRRAGASTITGVDLSAKMLARAARRDPAATLVRGDFAQLDLGGRFPRVLCSFALSLLPDPASRVAAIRRHMTSDGVLVVLDFGELEGAARVFSPAWRGWLARFGARTDLLARREAMARFFRETRAITRAGGMAAAVRFQGPRPDGG